MNLFLQIMILIGVGITSANIANIQESDFSSQAEDSLVLFGISFRAVTEEHSDAELRRLELKRQKRLNPRRYSIKMVVYGKAIVISKQKLATHIANGMNSVVRVYNFEDISSSEESQLPTQTLLFPGKIFKQSTTFDVDPSSQLPTQTLMFTVDTTFNRTFSNIECDVLWQMSGRPAPGYIEQVTETHLIIENCGNGEVVFKKSITLDINEIELYSLSSDGHISLD